MLEVDDLDRPRLHVHLCLEVGDPWGNAGGSLLSVELLEGTRTKGMTRNTFDC
jgi:hypothetical protein